MGRRMWKSQFRFYMLLVIAPLLAQALVLLISPAWFLKTAFVSPPELSGAFSWMARIAGAALAFAAMILLGARNNPGQSREVFFWSALLYLALCGLCLAGPFLSGVAWLFAGPAAGLYLLAAVFQLAFASRNLLVRE